MPAFFVKFQNISPINFTFVKKMEKDISHPKVSSKLDQPSWNYEPWKLLISFTNFCRANPISFQRELKHFKFNKKMLCVVTTAMICFNLAWLSKFQYFRSSIYKLVKNLWWSFYCENNKPLNIFTKKLHRRCPLGF